MTEPSAPQANKSSRPTHRKLGRYKLLAEVGRGATAYVFKAHDPELDRYLAVKVLRNELAENEEYKEAFIREARLAAQLTHPGIVTIFDVGEADGRPYIAMELLEGVTLDKILNKQARLPLKTVLSIATQVAHALNYAHQNGVVHRDIKPANIVILKDRKTAKITDFGIAQLTDQLGKTGLQSEKVLGTPEYMSPEQVLGKPLDARSDLYALGALIFRMLEGHPPFHSDDLAQLFKQIVKDKPPKLADVPDKVADDLQDLIRRLLRKRPERRFASAAEVVKELRRINKKLGKRDEQKRDTFVSLRLRWTLTMAGVVFAAMCVGLLIVYFVQLKSLSGITYDYGRSIARMLAYQSAESIVLDDHIGLNALIKESKENEQLVQASVLDLNDRVLAATDDQAIGKPFQPPQGRELQVADGAIRIYERKLDDKRILLDVEYPVRYSDKHVGWVYVTFSGESMVGAAQTTLITMLLVMMTTLIVVFIITLSLARRTSRDYQRVAQALLKMSYGRFDARLESERNDEAGQLFSAFNALANYLERRLENDDLPTFNSLPMHTQLNRHVPGEPGHDDELTVELEIEPQTTEDESTDKK